MFVLYYWQTGVVVTLLKKGVCSNCRGEKEKKNAFTLLSQPGQVYARVRTYSGPVRTKLHIVGSKSDSFAEGGGRSVHSF